MKIGTDSHPLRVIVTRDMGDNGPFASQQAKRYFLQNEVEGEPDWMRAQAEEARRVQEDPQVRGTCVVNGLAEEGKVVSLAVLFEDLEAAGYKLVFAQVFQAAVQRGDVKMLSNRAMAIFASPERLKQLRDAPTCARDREDERTAREDGGWLLPPVKRFFAEITQTAVRCDMNPDGKASVFIPNVPSKKRCDPRGAPRRQIRFVNGLLSSEPVAASSSPLPPEPEIPEGVGQRR
ncbi:hypothetical protein KBB27_01555 [Patescibacteria group bacterium]|nr:hypothetical protein [Patescibacteria group bacterium]